MISDRELMRFHVEAEFSHDAEAQLVRVNEPNGTGAAAPRFFLGKTLDGVVVRFRHDVGNDVRRELKPAVAHDVQPESALDRPSDPAPYQAILSRVAPVERTWTGPAFFFPRELPMSDGTTIITDANADILRPHLEAWIPDVPLSQPMIALTVDGHAASLCASVRLTADAHEAGVDTAPPFRGRGYAAQVVVAWAREVRDLGRIPLYSTSWGNDASRAVARKIGLIQFGNDLHVT